MAESTTEPLEALGGDLPGFQFVDHVAIAVPRGSLDAQVAAYRMLGFREIHREEVGGKDQVREVLLQIGSVGQQLVVGDRLGPSNGITVNTQCSLTQAVKRVPAHFT